MLTKKILSVKQNNMPISSTLYTVVILLVENKTLCYVTISVSFQPHMHKEKTIQTHLQKKKKEGEKRIGNQHILSYSKSIKKCSKKENFLQT